MRRSALLKDLGSILLAGILSTTLLAPPAVGAAEARLERKSHATMVIDFIDQYFEPRIKALGVATGQLLSSVKSYCRARDDDKDLDDVKESFAAIVKAWGAVEFVRFGPIMQDHRLERFFFWPDPRGTTARQLAMLLAKRDEAVLAPDQFRKQSVAVQGLSALEMLIYDADVKMGGADEAQRYRCAFATASASQLDTIARDVIEDWTRADGFRAKMLAPGSDNPLYKDASETAREMVKTFVTGVELALNRYVIPELTAAKVTPSKRVRVPFERSGLSVAFLKSGIDSLHALFEASGLMAYIPADKPWMKAFVPATYAGIDAGIVNYEKSRAAEPGSEERLAVMRKLRFDLSGLRLVVVKELAPGADITLGFNELDGD